MRSWAWIARVAVVSFVATSCTPKATLPASVATEFTPQYAGVYGAQEGAVASVNPIATQAGLNAFAGGGNAIDAALAVAFTLGVVDSHNSGVGGGCFILARLANGEIVAIDGREMAPAKASRDMYVVNGQVQSQWSKTGALAAGVPGSVAALDELQRLAGKLRLADVIEPAAVIAERGFGVDRTLAQRLSRTQAAIVNFPATAEIFLTPTGEPIAEGGLLIQKDLAASYRALAQEGPAWFYRGAFAQKTAAWMASHGGLLSQDDFANYHTVRRKPVVSQFHGYDVYGFPPPSSGGVHIAQMLNMLARFDLKGMTEVDRLHLTAEVMKLAFADRAYWLGDADFTAVPKGLITPEYAGLLSQKIDMRVANHKVEAGAPNNISSEQFNKHTTHIATADRWGNWVAITTTLNTSFGSKVVIPGTGILLNNQMDDFSVQPGIPNAFGLVGAEANSIAPGKRPLSSMSPTLVMQAGQPVLTLGAAGGPTIISQVLQALVYKLALGQPLPEALSGTRIHHQWRPDTLYVEPTVTQSVQEALISRGHTLKSLGDFGATQAIAFEHGHFIPMAEPRLIRRNGASE